MKLSKRDDLISLFFIVAGIALFFGTIVGWTSRALSTRDQLLLATISKCNAQREFYDAEIQKTLVSDTKSKEKKVHEKH